MLRCAAPLAAVTGSRAMLGEAAGLLGQASFPAGGAWMPGYEAYLSLAEAWLAHGDPEPARAVLAPMLAVADREPWLPALNPVGRVYYGASTLLCVPNALSQPGGYASARRPERPPSGRSSPTPASPGSGAPPRRRSTWSTRSVPREGSRSPSDWMG